MKRPCSVQGCTRVAAPRRHHECWTHIKRRQRRSPPIEEPVRPPAYPSSWTRLETAAIVLGNVDSLDEDAYQRARERLRKAAVTYATSLADVVHARPDTSVRGQASAPESDGKHQG